MNKLRIASGCLKQLTFFLVCASLAASAEPPQSATELRRFSAPEAHQAVAVDASSFYAITNRSIARYEKTTGTRLANWTAEEGSPIRHLNSGLVLNGRLYCANSNWPQTPRKNSIEVFDAKTLKHLRRKTFAETEGAINWIDHRAGSWWIVFAFYGENDAHRTRLVRFDESWNQTGVWMFPDNVVQRFLPNSNSGGAFGPDGRLYVTGHDHGELYVLDVPPESGELQYVSTIAAPITGQGIAWDRSETGLLYGIVRASREVVVMQLPHSPPNIVVVLVDDLRWDELGCTGHPFVRTPNIDRIAYQGARFRNAFCTTPLCSPARASLLTGLYTHHHGILDNTDRSPQSHALKTFPQVLQQHGYRTGYIGKWHMGNDDSARPGFDYWAGLQGQGSSFDPVVNVNGERTRFTGHTTDVLNEMAVEFLRDASSEPFCLYVAHKALHPELVQRDDGSITDPTASRFMPAERHRDLYAEEGIPRRLNVFDSVADKPALQREIEGLPPLSRETGTSDETVRDRLRMLAAVDDGVGLLLRELTRSGQLDQTVFIFTSDHGYWYGEHGLSVERRLAYEEGIRIPLLIRYPQMIQAGRLIDEITLSIDIAPTILKLAGADSPWTMDGRSLVPLLEGEQSVIWRHSFLIQYNTDTVFPRVHKMGYRAIRTPRWKYIRYNELEGMDELYDLKRDPYEMDNIVDQSNMVKTRTQLQQQLDGFLTPTDG